MSAQAIILQIFDQRIESRTAVKVGPQRGAQFAHRFQSRRHPIAAACQVAPDFLVQKAVDYNGGQVEPLRAHLFNQHPRLAQALVLGGRYQNKVDVIGMQ
ncbi:MAG TPA: hypothetical protein VKB84_17060 [Candidatus Binataceae bacterium]|nr:hypothetical protein [Candidatus Binataceae bacterium]